jgi:hypothetical protein
LLSSRPTSASSRSTELQTSLLLLLLLLQTIQPWLEDGAQNA